jgi:hypothetical protein
MPIALGILPMGEETLRHDEVQIVLRAGHCDIEQSTFFLDFGGGAGAEIGGDTAVHGIQHEDGLPLLPLCRMDRGQDQKVLIEQRRPAGCDQRSVGGAGQEALARRIAGRDLPQLQEVRLPDGGVLMDTVEVRLVPALRQSNLGWPGRAAFPNRLERANEGGPVIA